MSEREKSHRLVTLSLSRRYKAASEKEVTRRSSKILFENHATGKVGDPRDVMLDAPLL